MVAFLRILAWVRLLVCGCRKAIALSAMGFHAVLTVANTTSSALLVWRIASARLFTSSLRAQR
jgi:hypothetical protein